MQRIVCVIVMLAVLVFIAACAAPSTPTPPTAVPPTKAAAQPTQAPAATVAPTAAPPTATAAPKAPPTATTPPFPTKDITFIVPVSPGGGFDTYARMLAPYLKKYLPNQPNVVVKNVPGGEWRVGIMEMYKATPDGHTISIFNIPGNAMGPITGRAEYDLTKVAWIGRITDTVYVVTASPKSGIKTLDDMKKKGELKAGVVGLTSGSAIATILAASEMGFKVKLINFDGSSEALLATVRGDTDLAVFPFPSVQKFVVGSTDLTPVMVFSKTRLKELPNTPTAGDLGFEKLLAVVSLDYMVGATPGVPDSILKIWRDAFDKANQDAEFVAALTKQIKMTPGYLNGEQTAQKIKDTMEVYAKYKNLLMDFVPK